MESRDHLGAAFWVTALFVSASLFCVNVLLGGSWLLRAPVGLVLIAAMYLSAFLGLESIKRWMETEAWNNLPRKGD